MESDELEALRQAVRDVLNDLCSMERLRACIKANEHFHKTLWSSAAELGWMGLALPEEFGGSGMGMQGLAVVQEELGAALAPIPFTDTMLCAQAIVASGTDRQKRDYLPRIAAGELVATAMPAADALSGRAARVVQRGAALRLQGGVAGLVNSVDKNGPHLLLVFAADEQNALHALLVDPKQDGVKMHWEPAGDPTRSLSAATFDDVEVPAERVLAGIPGAQLAEMLLQQGALALACDASGGAARIFELTLEYLKTRQQFGRLIGSFQALKHRCADLKALLESSRCTVWEAVDRMHRGAAEAPRWASMAKFYACDAYARTTADSVQLHGGIGFTWEHYCHLFVKRAKLNQALNGGSEWHKDRVARLAVQEGVAA
jgi:alkylation response protein AidB-like acyl-CoA dehydrogenase